MSGRHRLEKLLQNPRIWIAGHGGPCQRVLPTGFVELDVALSGGWPVGQLIELLIDPCGIGELQLLMPALVGLIGAREGLPGESEASPEKRAGSRPHAGAGKWAMLIAPPYIPYAPAFADQGLDMACLLVVRCDGQADVLWAIEQALHSHTCVAILAWSGGADERSLRRLQLAAEADGACLLVLFRPLRFRRQRSPAALRIQLQPGTAGAINLHILKVRGGRPQTIDIDTGAGAELYGGK